MRFRARAEAKEQYTKTGMRDRMMVMINKACDLSVCIGWSGYRDVEQRHGKS